MSDDERVRDPRLAFRTGSGYFGDMVFPVAEIKGGEQVNSLTERRARFVYDGARLAAIAAGAPVVPVPWDEREDDFRAQFLDVIVRQFGPFRSWSPEELHGSWMQSYFATGWVWGEVHDTERRHHPDLVPYAKLGQLERDKDAVFVALCEIARIYIYDVEDDQ